MHKEKYMLVYSIWMFVYNGQIKERKRELSYKFIGHLERQYGDFRYIVVPNMPKR